MPDNSTEKHSMKLLPEDEQPYELAEKKGIETLSDAQLLSIILRTGSREETAVALARRILSSSRSGSLEVLFHMDKNELTAIRGIGRVKAIQLQALAQIAIRMARTQISNGPLFNSPEKIAAYYMEQMRHQEREEVILLALDAGAGLLAEEVISTGTLNCSVVSPREVYMTALKRRAAGIVLLHNHPSGDPSPSKEDISLTKRMAECGSMLDIALEDHIIIGDRKAYSFRKNTIIVFDEDS